MWINEHRVALSSSPWWVCGIPHHSSELDFHHADKCHRGGEKTLGTVFAEMAWNRIQCRHFNMSAGLHLRFTCGTCLAVCYKHETHKWHKTIEKEPGSSSRVSEPGKKKNGLGCDLTQPVSLKWNGTEENKTPERSCGFLKNTQWVHKREDPALI